MRISLCLCVLVFHILSSPIAAQQSAPPSAAPLGNVTNGQTLYLKTGCYQCHGNEGQGGTAGPRLAPAPMLAFRAFVTYIRAPRGEMPPYTTKVMSEQNLADIYAYLAARRPPPALNSIPLLLP